MLGNTIATKLTTKHCLQFVIQTFLPVLPSPQEDKEKNVNPYAYQPQKKKKNSIKHKRGHEEASAAMMRCEAIRRKQKANDQKRENH